MEGVGRGVLEERVGGEDGTDAVDFFYGEWIKRVARCVCRVIAVAARGFVGFFNGFVLEAILGSAP